MAGVPADDPGIRKALVFVAGCQNDPGGPRPEPAFDDGGFFFTPTDPVRNKAGVAGNDGQGRRRFHSYGSATADGLRALLRCGMPHDHPRVLAARAWLERHFSVKENPGRFEPLREPEREATYYYYTWSVAHALRALGVERIDRDGKPVDWAGELSRELVRRQRPDGFWQNRASASREDDPFIATAFALGALANCRMVGGHAP